MVVGFGVEDGRAVGFVAVSFAVEGGRAVGFAVEGGWEGRRGGGRSGWSTLSTIEYSKFSLHRRPHWIVLQIWV